MHIYAALVCFLALHKSFSCFVLLLHFNWFLGKLNMSSLTQRGNCIMFRFDMCTCSYNVIKTHTWENHYLHPPALELSPHMLHCKSRQSSLSCGFLSCGISPQYYRTCVWLFLNLFLQTLLCKIYMLTCQKNVAQPTCVSVTWFYLCLWEHCDPT